MGTRASIAGMKKQEPEAHNSSPYNAKIQTALLRFTFRPSYTLSWNGA
jgi:hypothetical protein